VLLITSDRGLCGGYNANAIRSAEQLITKLRQEGKHVALYVVGRKGIATTVSVARARGTWSGFSEQPRFSDAQRIGEALIQAFTSGADETEDHPGADGVLGVDELHVVYTPVQVAYDTDAGREDLRAMQVEERTAEEAGVLLPAYEFEPTRRAARRAAAEVHQHAASTRRCWTRRPASRLAAAGDEERHRQRRRNDQGSDPRDELRAQAAITQESVRSSAARTRSRRRGVNHDY
jgi:F-type H+-transporting ATPase subunit gamma